MARKKWLLIGSVLLLAGSLAGCGGSGGNGGGGTHFDGQLMLTSEGSDLVLLGVGDDGSLTEVGRASLPADELANYNDSHTIFGIARHPSKAMVYVTSFNDYFYTAINDYENGPFPQWGNGRIDKFTYTNSGVTYAGLAYLMQGALRLSVPTFNAGSRELSLNLINQSDEEISIATVVASNLTAGSSAANTCDGIDLAAGATCSITITAGAGVEATADLVIDAGGDMYATQILYVASSDTYEPGEMDGPGLDASECANDFWDDGDFRVIGRCAPTNIALSADGLTAYVNEDDADKIVVFTVDAVTGNLTYENDDASSGQQGIAVNADNTYVYNGLNTYSVAGTTLTLESGGNNGNATEVVSDGSGIPLLLNALGNNSLAVHELDTDPAAPTLVDSLDFGSRLGRTQHHSSDLSIFTVGGDNTVRSVSFDGTDLTELDSEFEDFAVPGCEVGVTPGADDCMLDRVNRRVQMRPDGLYVVSAWFLNPNDDDATLDDAPISSSSYGGLAAYNVAPAVGTLTKTDEIAFSGPARALLAVPQPKDIP